MLILLPILECKKSTCGQNSMFYFPEKDLNIRRYFKLPNFCPVSMILWSITYQKRITIFSFPLLYFHTITSFFPWIVILEIMSWSSCSFSFPILLILLTTLDSLSPCYPNTAEMMKLLYSYTMTNYIALGIFPWEFDPHTIHLPRRRSFYHHPLTI